MAASLIDKLAAERVGVSGQITVQDIKNLIVPTHYPTEIRNSGRMYCYNDTRWVTNADDNYGPNYYQFLESGTTSVDPVMEWEHQGDLIRPGTKLHDLTIAFRNIDLTNIVDIEIIAVFTSYQGRLLALDVGIDNDGEDAHTILYRTFLKAGDASLDPITAPFNDRHARILPLGNFEATELGDVRIYLKPVNNVNRTNTSTDFVQLTYMWGLSLPLFAA